MDARLDLATVCDILCVPTMGIRLIVMVSRLVLILERNSGMKGES